jgi:hypothetical protein
MTRGKSSLLKSIYSTFGADPPIVHPAWRLANVITVLRFTLDGKRFTAARSGDSHYAFFDAEDRVLGTFSRLTSELAPFIADLLGFKLRLADREGRLVAPPPAYLFLPFYVDQDSGWQRNWSSFGRLQQLPGNWRKEVAEYHAGIRSNEYYFYRGELERLKQERQRLVSESQALSGVRDRVKVELPAADFSFSLEEFKDELALLLEEARHLSAIETKYKAEMVALHTQRHVLQEQIAITVAALTELRADYEFAAERLQEHVDCPMCGASYDNGFAERFAIATDENRMNELLLQLQTDAQKLAQDIQDAEVKFGNSHDAAAEAHRLLATRKGDVTLQLLVTSEGQREVGRVLKSNLDNYYAEIATLERQITTSENALKETEDRQRGDEIRDFYLKTIQAALRELDVQRIRDSSFVNMWAQVKETGSDLPRALLAFYYSYLSTVRRYSTATFCPIVMDELNQQGQDEENLPKMITFALQQQPKDSQLILGLESLHGVQPSGKVIELTVKNRVLVAEEFEEVSAIVAPLLNDSLTHAAGEHSTKRLFAD